jgi:hypothetical protein
MFGMKLGGVMGSLLMVGWGGLLLRAETVDGEVVPMVERVTFEARASELDPTAREYPEIKFGFGSDEKPQDLQSASVDLGVALRGELVIWLMGDNDALFERLNSYGLHVIRPHMRGRGLRPCASRNPWTVRREEMCDSKRPRATM